MLRNSLSSGKEGKERIQNLCMNTRARFSLDVETELTPSLLFSMTSFNLLTVVLIISCSRSLPRFIFPLFSVRHNTLLQFQIMFVCFTHLHNTDTLRNTRIASTSFTNNFVEALSCNVPCCHFFFFSRVRSQRRGPL